MATSIARFSFSPLLSPHNIKPSTATLRRWKRLPAAAPDGWLRQRRLRWHHDGGRCRAYKVTIEHGGEQRTLEVDEDETILGRALEVGLEIPHDCKLGVCMTCPARLLAGAVDQSEGMLSDDVIASGYALLCASYPRSDCVIRTIPEDELLSLQLATAND